MTRLCLLVMFSSHDGTKSGAEAIEDFGLLLRQRARQRSTMELVMWLANILNPKQLEAPFVAVVVGLTYVCGLLLLGQLL